MNSVTNKINNYKIDDNQHYASNDSGLSCDSNGCTESDIKVNLQDFPCDDLTKSLFINSFRGNEVIQDDDIYSYKSKMNIGGIYNNKFRSLNLQRFENFNFKSASTYKSIIHDMENLKVLEQTYLPTTINNYNNQKEGFNLPYFINSSLRISDDTKCDLKNDLSEKIRTKRNLKKNTTQEYLASSIEDYHGDKALNDIVSFIQGSTKQSKTRQPNKGKTKTPSIKVEECPPLLQLEQIITVVADAINEKCVKQSHSNIDVDSGTQSSQYVSLNNSDEDSIHVFVEDFQQVISKKQKKTTSIRAESQLISPSLQNVSSNFNSTSSIKVLPNKVKKCGKYKRKGCSNSILHSKESLQDFLSKQYLLFTQRYNMLS